MRRVALACFLAILTACDGPSNDCDARGGTSPYAGSASYTGQTWGGSSLTPLTGSYAETVLVYDANEGCYYDGMEFPVGVGSCLLWASLPNSGQDGGTILDAMIEPGQSCTLGLPSGSFTVNVTSGALSIGEPTTLTLAGPVTGTPDGASAGSGAYLQWSFVGQ